MRSSSRFDRPRLIATKFRAPAGTSGLVARERLLARLESERHRRLTLIHGPAGFGKTTLSVQWRERLQRSDATVAWLSMSREDNSIDRFLTYLVEAVRVADPGLSVDVADQLEAQPEQAAAIVVTELINTFERAERDFYIVVDDWHLIVDREVRDTMVSLLEHAPRRFHLVITSRERPALPLATLRVAGELCEVTAADLRFTVAESQAFLCEVNALRLDPAAVQSLWTSTEGWVAALQLASLSLRHAVDAQGSAARLSSGLLGSVDTSFGANHRALGEYLAENVLDSLLPDVLDFLLATSILDRLCAGLCAAVSGLGSSQSMLERLDEQDLFIQPLDEHREWYRYHHLFAAHLQRRLERQSPERKAELHRAASAWFSANAHVDEAVTHALAAGDTERAVDVVANAAMWLVQHSAMSTLRVLVLRLPPDRLGSRPALQLAIAWAHCLTHRPQQARDAVASLVAELTSAAAADTAGSPAEGVAADETTEALAEARVVEACVRIYQDDIDGVEALVKPCVAPCSRFHPWVVAVASNVYTYVLLQRNSYDDAITLQAQALPYHERTQGPFSAVYGRCFAGMAARELGRLDDAASYFRSAHELAATGVGLHSHAARLAEALLGELLVEMNQLDEAAHLLDDSRALGMEGGVADFFIARYVGSSRLLAHRRDPDAATDVLDEGEQTFKQLGFWRLGGAIFGERIRHALLNGDVAAARRWLEQSNGLVTPAGSTPSNPTPHLPRGHEHLAMAQCRVLLASGRPAQAAAVLRPVLNAAIEGRRLLLEVRARILMCLATDGVGRLDQAVEMAANTLRVGLDVGMRRSFLDEGARFIEITALVQERVLSNQIPRAQWSAAALAGLSELSLLGRRADATGIATATEPGSAAAPPFASAGACASLKQREAEILQLLERGLSNKEIARCLDIGVDTVKWYLKSIYGKLGVANRAQAVFAARGDGSPH
ncbi:MAG: LuxR family transcriptional regulator [Burkholderiales bacterium PBB1]|nr:MAG: LuxR family transcriptional regulator [Burkholderiales bacterium PBB1]